MSCNTGTLNPYIPTTQNPWDKNKIKHLYRRIGYGASTLCINQTLTQNPSAFIENTINDVIALGATTPPVWANMAYSDYTGADPDIEIQQQHAEIAFEWTNEMLENSYTSRIDAIRGRFTMFWSNHFVTRLEDYWCPSWMFNYYETLQTYAFGNFKEFVRAIGITPSMIVFLNSYQNTASEPNENYARELYELFTLGVNNNYTQTDIVETAKALTGFTNYTEYCAPINFNIIDFDAGSKTIFGQTNTFDYDGVIDNLFAQRGSEIAHYICEKLYKYFISPDVDTAIVAGLATTFMTNNFELAPVYKQLFKSEHFFDDKAIGVIVKSPNDLFNAFAKETIPYYDNTFLGNVIYYNGEIGQTIFEPLDVSGWQGNHDWINSSTLVGRWGLSEWYLYRIWDNQPNTLRDFAVNLVGNSNDPAVITQVIVDHLISNGLQNPADYAIATDVLKDQVPQNYYDDNSWSLQWGTANYQVFLLLIHIIKIPEFQLK
ncbi:MAG: DUF1800 domain-containing protein [Flavobacteriaceae bacterium]